MTQLSSLFFALWGIFAASASPAPHPESDEALATKATLALEQGDLRTAYNVQRQRYERIARTDDYDERASLALECAVLAVMNGYLDEAQLYLRAATGSATAAQDDELLAKAHSYRAIVAERQGEHDVAAGFFQKSHETYLAAGRLAEAGRQLVSLGNLYKDGMSRFPLALRAYDQAEALFGRTVDADAVLAVRIDKGNALLDVGRTAAARDLLRNTQARLSPDHAPKAWVRASLMLAKAHYRLGDFQAAEGLTAALTRRLPLLKDPGLQGGLEVDALNLRAMVQAETGRRDQAFALFEQALKKAEALGLLTKQAYLHNNLGYWLRESGRFDEALAHHEQALALDHRLRSAEGTAFDLRNLGLTWLARDEVAVAGRYLEEALAQSLRLGTPYNTAQCYLGLGEVALREDRPAEAAAAFRRARELAQAATVKSLEWQALAGLARALVSQGALDAGVTTYRQALELIDGVEAGLGSDEARRLFRDGARAQAVTQGLGRALLALQRDQEAAALNSR